MAENYDIISLSLHYLFREATIVMLSQRYHEAAKIGQKARVFFFK